MFNLRTQLMSASSLLRRTQISGLPPSITAGTWGRTAVKHTPWLAVFGALLIAPALAGGQNASNTDANAIVRQMIAVYQGATTIQETSAANFIDNKGTKFSQTYRIKYQRPNKLVIIAEDPQDGTLAAYSNGKVVRFYSGKRRNYTENSPSSPPPPDLKGTMDLINERAQHLTGGVFDQNLNPISFLLAQGMPKECGNFKFAGIKSVEGHKVYVVTGTAELSWAQTIVPASKGKSTVRDLTLFIDTSTHLLLRAKAHLVWASVVPARGGKPAKEFGIQFEETHFGTTLDQPLLPNDFTFTPKPDVVLKH